MALFPHKLMVGMNPGDGGEELKTVSSKSIQDIGVAALVVSLQKKKKKEKQMEQRFFFPAPIQNLWLLLMMYDKEGLGTYLFCRRFEETPDFWWWRMRRK